MTIQRILFCAAVLLLCVNGASAARYQRCKDGKTMVWNSLRGVAQDASWSGLRDLNGYATGEGTLSWYRLGSLVNSYTGKMVRGKFEGPVVRQQGNTRLQANFANGEKVSGWSEPGSSGAAVGTPVPNKQTEQPEELPTESATPIPARIPLPTPTAWRPSLTPTVKPSPSPTPTPESSPTPTPTATLRPSPTPTPALMPRLISPTPTPTPTPRAASISTPTGMPALVPTATPIPSGSFSSPLSEPRPAAPATTAAGEGAANGLELAHSPGRELKMEQAPRSTATPPVKSTSAAPRLDGSRKLDPNMKRQLIAEFKKEIDGVFGEVRGATNNFHEVDRLDQVRSLPKAVSSHVTLLTASAEEFRTIVGYDVTFYECLAEMQTVDALLVVDQATSIIAEKDTPIARKTLSAFRARYPKAPAEAQKPLWTYLDSMYALCDRLKNEAEGRLGRARSLESEGKKADALREYREINKIYPNKVTAERIRLLEAASN